MRSTADGVLLLHPGSTKNCAALSLGAAGDYTHDRTYTDDTRMLARRSGRGRPAKKTARKARESADNSPSHPQDTAEPGSPPPRRRPISKAQQLDMMLEMHAAMKAMEARYTRLEDHILGQQIGPTGTHPDADPRAVPAPAPAMVSRSSPASEAPRRYSDERAYHDYHYGDDRRGHDYYRGSHWDGYPPSPRRAQHRRREDRPRSPPTPPMTRRRRPPIATDSNAATTAEEAVRLIIAAADGKATKRKKGIPTNYIFPYDLVERGEDAKTVKKGEATQEEYTLGLKRLETEDGFPEHALQALSNHQEWVAHDNCNLSWPVVRMYSEEIFTRIADGRLPRGWMDEAAINAVRVEVIATTAHNPIQGRQQSSRQTSSVGTAYDKATHGAPCPAWNRGADRCTKAEKGLSHGSGAQRMAHICGYCANVRHVVTNHTEAACYSKKSRPKASSTKADADF